MTLVQGCGFPQSMWELIFSAIRQLATGQNAIAVVGKVAAANPDECAGKIPVEEKIRSAISISCGTINSINIISNIDFCGANTTPLDCNTGSWTMEDYINSIMQYTTDGEWAFNFVVVNSQ